ncbi:MAG: TrkA C-terminal domain-containing protein [Oscillospiraceae bacterium]
MKPISAKEKMSYRIDKLLSKGTGMLILALFSITGIIVIGAGVLMVFVDPEFANNPIASIWGAFMFALDAGTLAGYTTNVVGIMALAAVTLCGIFITSMLIGVLSSGLEAKLEALRRGDSRVLEQNHTVIIGYNDNIFAIIGELIIANENATKPVIVVLGEQEKADMESALGEKITDTKNTEIICRSGCMSDLPALSRCSVETARSIIINSTEDSEVIKTILAVTHILKQNEEDGRNVHITAGVNEQRNVEVAKIAGEGKVEVIYFKSAVSRIIANTCHQPGLSEVYTELFNFDGDEIYIEPATKLFGKTFGESINLFEKSILLGIKKGNQPILNPPYDTIIEEGDSIIVLADDNGVSIPTEESPKIEAELLNDSKVKTSNLCREHLLVLGYNELLPDILNELDNYVAPNSIITVGTSTISQEEREVLERSYNNMTVTVDVCDIYNGQILEAYVDMGYLKIIVLSRLDCDIQESDALNLMILLHLKAIREKRGVQYSVVSQMLSPQNGELAKIANVNDFVVSTNLTALILSQISEDRDLAAIFEDILDADGSELYMKPASLYVKTHVPVTICTAAYAAAVHGEVFLGYKNITVDKDGNSTLSIVTNPPKTDTAIFTEGDWFIVLAEEG